MDRPCLLLPESWATIVPRLTGGDLVDPSIIWPLLTAEFPEVHTAATFVLANVLLHELAVSS